jgi:hypothetical protein
MSTDRSTTPRAPCACIDPSPLYLWPLADVIELFPCVGADSPQARRLAVLLAEAQASGQHTAVLRTLAEWARLLLSDVPPHAGRAALVGAIGAAEAVALRKGAALPNELRTLLTELSELEAPALPAERAAVALASWTLAHVAAVVLTAEQAWHTATDVLCAVAEQAGDTADATIARCALRAHAALFWPPATNAA